MLLRVRNLRTSYFPRHGEVRAVDGATFDLDGGECLCLVGESGSGKAATALSILGLIDPPGRVLGGEIILKGANLLDLPPERMREVRARDIGAVFQHPQPAMNPVLRVGDQIAERLLLTMGRGEAEARALELMGSLGIPAPSERYRQYPHQFSGGMLQRAMIAMALATNPGLVIADEPTSALDVTVQAQILELFQGLREEGRGILFITHDLGVVAELADRVAVMHGGKIVEAGDVYRIFENPSHPYTQKLLGCFKRVSGVV